jgi:fumarylpyruvate hydrolase
LRLFDGALNASTTPPASDVPDIAQAAIALTVNGAPRQASHIHKLIWNVAETIAHLSAAWELQAGDLIYTGTPEGVAAVQSGDTLHGTIDGLDDLHLRIV